MPGEHEQWPKSHAIFSTLCRAEDCLQAEPSDLSQGSPAHRPLHLFTRKTVLSIHPSLRAICIPPISTKSSHLIPLYVIPASQRPQDLFQPVLVFLWSLCFCLLWFFSGEPILDLRVGDRPKSSGPAKPTRVWWQCGSLKVVRIVYSDSSHPMDLLDRLVVALLAFSAGIYFAKPKLSFSGVDERLFLALCSAQDGLSGPK